MNRLNKTVSAVFKHLMLCFQRIFFSDYVLHGPIICPLFALNLKSYYYVRPNIIKFDQLMNLKKVAELKNLCRVINFISKSIRS